LAATKPNFFIVGAPKCGTTALYEYLRPHPHIFMSEVKEPHFFARDMAPYPRIKTPEDYSRLFAKAAESHLRVGEASVYYLRSSVAIPNIRAFNPGAKIIAMFRNPIDMVYSLHAQLVYVSEEDEADFETAWRLQDRRRQGLDLPPRIRSPLLVQYAEIGMFGAQTQRLLACFPRSQVKLILYDDFAADPKQVYADVMRFLDIPHDGRTEFPRVNESKRTRLDWLRKLSRKPPPTLRQAFRNLKEVVGPERVSSVKKKIVALNTVTGSRAPLSARLRAELRETFRDDLELFSQLINRDLSHWV
jgi:hypothetical protein